jgi:hypothetical protein
MPELNDRAVALLERLVELQSAANARQEQALAASEAQYAEARRRGEEAIALQKTAVERQRWFIRVWLGVLVFIIAVIAGLLVVLGRYLH